jgi:hypothetical protein
VVRASVIASASPTGQNITTWALMDGPRLGRAGLTLAVSRRQENLAWSAALLPPAQKMRENFMWAWSAMSRPEDEFVLSFSPPTPFKTQLFGDPRPTPRL